MDEGDGTYGEAGDQVDHFHRNEAISAVADEGFLIDEDDDFEDLYNDVNVGENFLQSMRKNEDVGFRNEPVEERKNELPPPAAAVSRAPPTGVDGVGEVDTGGDSGYQNQGFRDEVKGQSGSGPVATGSSGLIRVELAAQRSDKFSEMEELSANTSAPSGPQGFVQQPNGIAGVNVNPGNVGPLRGMGNDSLPSQSGIRNTYPAGGNGIVNAGGSSSVVAVAASGSGAGNGGGGGTTMLFVGDLHWWTTDAELEAELCKYGQVKEVKFFDEKASGKSKGYCQVEFFEPASATACKEGMNGHIFNGKACVVAFASPASIRRMGEAQMNRNQQGSQTAAAGQGRRGPNDIGLKTGGNNLASGGNFQGGDNNRGFGRGNWGRVNAQGMGNRGGIGPMRNRGAGMGGRDLMGNVGNGFGQGMGGAPPLMHPQTMMGQGFDPAFGGPMGRLGGYGGYPGAPAPPYSGLLPTFPPIGGVGLPGVAPHVNPAIFGRGMPMNGMGMMPGSGAEGPNVGMWSGNSMGGWGRDDHGGGRAGESSYGEEAASDHQYGEVTHDRGGWPNSSKEKDRGAERDWSGSSDRRYHDDKEMAYERDAPREKEMGHDREWSERRHRNDRDGDRERDRDHDRDRERSRDRDHERDRDRDRGRDRERERHREDRDRYSDHHRYRDHDPEHGDDYERGRSSRTHSKSRLSQGDDHRSRSREADYGKSRR